MLHLPEVFPDETFYSLLARISALNGMSNHLQVFRELFGHPSPTSIVNASGGIDRFCDLTRGAYGTVGTIRCRMTIYPLLAHLNVFPPVDGQANRNLATWLDGSAFDYSGNTRNEWRQCPVCLIDDETYLGVSYWRRSHQLPSTYCCPTHGEPLRRFTLPGKWLHERFWLPHELDAQAAAPDSIRFKPDVSKALATIGNDALNDNSEPFHADVIRNTFYEAIRDRHLLTRTGKIRWPECLDDFNSAMHLVSCNPTIPEWSIRQLLLGLQGSKTDVPIQHYVFLVYWLFGTWKHFKLRCSWVATLHYPSGSLPCRKAATNSAEKEQQSLLDGYRQVCMNYLQHNPTASRSEFLKQEYKCFRWLLRNDSKWLDSHFPMPMKKGSQKDLFNCS